ncbi:2-hydroxyacid dehydrogenase [Ferrovibrio sp.]|uniref:2-hydroxyacid dehydrogenase n=1 Tax=Ferrovibrio sp. TaxID=1917215 RepID=UPI0025C0DFC6|nr:2-hydroxyacid dehydrogenase [Ferrovibrio sp.]MBX3456195.1 2-hydroxyacid dehydrogenase [Ferrovibrio sp.]
MAAERIEILQVGPSVASFNKALDDAYGVHKLWLAPDRAALLAEVGPRVRAIATTAGFGAKRDLIAALPKLEIVACFGVGVDAIDTAYCKERGIPVTNTPDVLTEDVADTAIALTLATLRRLPQADRFIRDGKWGDAKRTGGNFPLADTLGRKTMGIFGMGRIGQATAKRAEACGMRVVYTGPRAKPELPQSYLPSLRALAEACDVLMITSPGGAATAKQVNAEILQALGPKGYVVNVARGSIIDEQALIAALQNRTIAGAGLDVFAEEPNVPEALWAMENVVLLPHIGSATQQTRDAMGALTVRNLAAHFAGEPLLTPYG